MIETVTKVGVYSDCGKPEVEPLVSLLPVRVWRNLVKIILK